MAIETIKTLEGVPIGPFTGLSVDALTAIAFGISDLQPRFIRAWKLVPA